MRARHFLGLLIPLCIVISSGGGNAQPKRIGLQPANGITDCIQQNDAQTLLCGRVLAADGVTPYSGAVIKLRDKLAAALNLPSSAFRSRKYAKQCISDESGAYACILPAGISGFLHFELIASSGARVYFEEAIVMGGISESELRVR